MTPVEIPDDNHFARHCSGVKGNDFSDEADGYHQPPWLNGRTFQPKATNPDVSGLWVDHVPGSREEKMERIRRELINSTRKINKNTHQFAIVKVERIRELGRRFSRGLHVLHTPDIVQRLPSHADIRGILPEDRVLQQKIADEATLEPVCPNAFG